jgi:RNA polymerase sigma-70 factor (ECF subfamily)
VEGPAADLADLLRHGFRYAFSLTHDRSRAEDLLQDAWVAVLKANGPHTRGYLLSAIRSRFINLYRRERIVPTVSLTGLIDSTRVDRGAEDSTSFLPDLLALEKSLSSLRSAEREALFLSAVEGYTAQEIADLTDQPRGTVLSLIHRARVKLRRSLEVASGEGNRELENSR